MKFVLDGLVTMRENFSPIIRMNNPTYIDRHGTAHGQHHPVHDGREWEYTVGEVYQSRNSNLKSGITYRGRSRSHCIRTLLRSLLRSNANNTALRLCY